MALSRGLKDARMTEIVRVWKLLHPQGVQRPQLCAAIVGSAAYRVAMALVLPDYMALGADGVQRDSWFAESQVYEDHGGCSVCAVTVKCGDAEEDSVRQASLRFHDALHGQALMMALLRGALLAFLRSNIGVPGYWDKDEFISSLRADLKERGQGGYLPDPLGAEGSSTDSEGSDADMPDVAATATRGGARAAASAAMAAMHATSAGQRAAAVASSASDDAAQEAKEADQAAEPAAAAPTPVRPRAQMQHDASPPNCMRTLNHNSGAEGEVSSWLVAGDEPEGGEPLNVPFDIGNHELETTADIANEAVPRDPFTLAAATNEATNEADCCKLNGANVVEPLAALGSRREAVLLRVHLVDGCAISSGETQVVRTFLERVAEERQTPAVGQAACPQDLGVQELSVHLRRHLDAPKSPLDDAMALQMQARRRARRRGDLGREVAPMMVVRKKRKRKKKKAARTTGRGQSQVQAATSRL